MAKLCYKVSETVKKYDLKDSANKPRLAVKYNGATKYLGLAAGPKDGELNLKLNGQTLYVKTWDIDSASAWRGMSPEEPFRGMGASRGETSHGGIGVWVLVNEENYPVVAFGRLGADRPDEWAKAIWYPSVEGTDLVTRFPNNFRLTAEQVTHPKRLKPNIRLATITSAAGSSQTDVINTTSIYATTLNGDRYANKNSIILNDIVTRLTTKSGNYTGSYGYYMDSYSTSSGGTTYWATGYGYGYDQINQRGVYFPTGTEELGSGTSYNIFIDSGAGIDSDGFKVNSPTVYIAQVLGSYMYYRAQTQYGIYTGITSSYGSPYIQMYGLSDSYSNYAGDWAQRDFYIEFPYAWGEDTNPNDYFNFSPKQLLNAVKAIATEKGVADYNYGFARGYNY